MLSLAKFMATMECDFGGFAGPLYREGSLFIRQSQIAVIATNPRPDVVFSDWLKYK